LVTTEDPVYTHDTEGALAEWLEAYGGADVLGQQTVDAVTAYLSAEDALRADDVAEAERILDALWAQYPVTDASWGGTGWSIAGEHVGYPAAYYGLRMLTEVVAQGGAPNDGAEPIQLTLVLVGCSEGIQPRTLNELAAGTGEAVELSLNADLVASSGPWVDQATWSFTKYIQAITDGALPLQVEVVELPELCLPIAVTDDGLRVAGPTDVSAVWDALPDDVVQDSNWFWVLHPSAVPTTPDFEGMEFITGGMGVHPTGAPLFLSDDLWLVRKPPHMGVGPWYEIERRVYMPQWLQHEFMHHLFRVYPEYGLEVTSHQWFDRGTWPADFEGVYEPDYYAEAVSKRLRDADPPLESLRYGVVPDGHFADLDPTTLLGNYQRLPVENEWHEGTIAEGEDGWTWTNAAGVSWGLTPRLQEGLLRTGADCPYDDDFRLEATRDPSTGAFLGGVSGFRFSGELYELGP
jgi:hypothetical protein